MTTILTRLYASADEASAAADTLLENGFVSRDIDLISGGEGHTAESLAGNLAQAGVFTSVAGDYATRVAGGESALVVRAPFGMAKRGATLLGKHNSLDAGIKHANAYVGDLSKQDEPFKWPLPELLNVTFMTGDDPPFKGRSWTMSGMLGLPFFANRGSGTKLISEKRFSESMGMKMLWDHRAKA